MTTREWFRKLRAAEWDADHYRAGRVDILAKCVDDLHRWEPIQDGGGFSPFYSYAVIRMLSTPEDVYRSYLRALDSHGFRAATRYDGEQRGGDKTL
jgi:hypothetical protein